jgi:hypothetical protein
MIDIITLHCKKTGLEYYGLIVQRSDGDFDVRYFMSYEKAVTEMAKTIYKLTNKGKK